MRFSHHKSISLEGICNWAFQQRLQWWPVCLHHQPLLHFWNNFQQVCNEQLERICWEFDQYSRSVNGEYCAFQLSAQFLSGIGTLAESSLVTHSSEETLCPWLHHISHTWIITSTCGSFSSSISDSSWDTTPFGCVKIRCNPWL